MNDLAAAKSARRIEPLLGLAVLLVSGLFIVSYLAVASQRIGYPYELEWMEGASVDHVAHLRSGELLYGEPKSEFVPFIYTPGYFYAASGLSYVFGISFLPLRLLSFLSSLGCLAMIGLFVERETKNRRAGLAAAGLFAATFRLSGSWFDLARVDSFFLFLLLAGCYLAHHFKSRRGAILAGVVLAAAFQTKQTALVVTVPVLLAVGLTRGPRGLIPGVSFLLTWVASVAVLDSWHGGWYWYYTLDLPRQHAIAYESVAEFWTKDVWKVLPVFLVGASFLLLQVGRAWLTNWLKGPLEDWLDGRRGRAHSLVSLAFASSMLLSAWLSRLHSGGYLNVLLPLHAAVAIAAGCCWGRSYAESQALIWVRIRALVSVAFLVQFGLLIYNPLDQVPSAAHRTAFSQVVRKMKETDGPVIVPYHGYLASLAGKQRYSQHMAVADVERGSNPVLRDKLKSEIEGAIERKAFAAIILDVRQFHQDVLEQHYYFAGPLVANPDDLMPLTGAPYRPWRLYLPR